MRSAGVFYKANNDKGIQTSQNNRLYALSRKFEPFTNEGKDLIIQFTVKHEQDIDCGGGYIKLFNCNLEPQKLQGETPFEIMFGKYIEVYPIAGIVFYEDFSDELNKSLMIYLLIY